jgi:hypothetical protein
MKFRRSSLVRSTLIVALLVSLFLGPTVSASAGGGPMPSPTPTQTHTKKPKPAAAPSISAACGGYGQPACPAPTASSGPTASPAPTPTPVASTSESAVPSGPATPTTSVAPETTAATSESATPEAVPTTKPDLNSNPEDSNFVRWLVAILVVAALVGGGGLVARSRGRKEVIPESVSLSGVDLASAPSTSPALTLTQSPEGELLWGDLDQQDRAKFEQAIRDFGLES